MKSGIFDPGLSDHALVYAFMKERVVKFKTKVVNFRSTFHLIKWNHLITLSEFILYKFHFMLNTTLQLANVNVELDELSMLLSMIESNFHMGRLTGILLQKQFLRKLQKIGHSL